MNILLTGAAGFTGFHFKQLAESVGHTVIPFEADLRDPVATRAAVAAAPCDAVVHLAAISFVGHADSTAFYAVNVVGTTNLLQAIIEKGDAPRKILIASSANIYGNCKQSPISETQPPAPANHYAASKVAMEHMVHTFTERLPIVITRPFNYTGAGQSTQFIIPKLVQHFALKSKYIELGNLDVEREFNDVRMVCRSYLSLLDQGHPGETYNVCTGTPYALRQVIHMLEEITKHKPDINVNPAFVRNNEVHQLTGNPSKLIQCIGSMCNAELHETLAWMLNH